MTTSTTPQTQENQMNALVQASNLFAESPKELSKTLSGLKTMTPGVNIAPAYMEFAKEGQTVRGIFLGFMMQEFTDQNTGEIRELECIGVMDEQQNVSINAGTSLVGAFKASKLAQYSPIEIKYTGQKKVQRGFMKVYEVRPLVAPGEKN